VTEVLDRPQDLTESQDKGPKKKCTKCGLPRPLKLFRTIQDRKTKQVRRHSWCIPCQQEHQRNRRKATSTVKTRAKEADRVAMYATDDQVRERRSARSAAQYRALAELRERHRDEYSQLYKAALRSAGLDEAA
jgi:hypothetical protein